MSEDKIISVAFQGERGAFSEDAAISFFGSDLKVKPCVSFYEVFESVTNGDTEYGIVPAENSQAGSINQTYDLLLDFDLQIIGEAYLRVVHCLMADPSVELSEIKTVYSHPQALAQCQEYLRRHPDWEVVSTYDTAGSAKMVAEKGLKDSAAIANERAAAIYGLKILQEGIESHHQNYTRFFILSEEPAPPAEKNKTSLLFSTRNVPGALYKSLGAFARRNINLTKLESRPSRLRPWRYIYYLDFEGHSDDPKCKDALFELLRTASLMKILGSYPAADESLWKFI